MIVNMMKTLMTYMYSTHVTCITRLWNTFTIWHQPFPLLIVLGCGWSSIALDTPTGSRKVPPYPTRVLSPCLLGNVWLHVDTRLPKIECPLRCYETWDTKTPAWNPCIWCLNQACSSKSTSTNGFLFLRSSRLSPACITYACDMDVCQCMYV